MCKQYKLIHLGTGEQVFGIHSKAWFITRLNNYAVCFDKNRRVKWRLDNKKDPLLYSDTIICKPFEFDLVEVINDSNR